MRWVGRSIAARTRERSAVGPNADPVLGGDGVQRGGRRADRRVARRTIDLLGDGADEAVQGVGGVVDLGRDLAIDRAAGRVTPDPRWKGVGAACPERRVDHAVDIRVQLEPLRAERVLGALEGHRDGLLQRLRQVGVELVARLVSGQPADVQVAHPDPCGDLVGVGPVEGVGADCQQKQHREGGGEGYLDSASHVEKRSRPARQTSVGAAPGVFGGRRAAQLRLRRRRPASRRRRGQIPSGSRSTATPPRSPGCSRRT